MTSQTDRIFHVIIDQRIFSTEIKENCNSLFRAELLSSDIPDVTINSLMFY